MLRAASGLGDTTLKPWYLHVHYQIFDPYGKAKGNGTLEYVWAGEHKWHITYTEGSTVWTRWGTEKGIYSPQGQADSLSYPTYLILSQFLHPLGNSENDRQAPSTYAKESFGKNTLSCFSTAAQFKQNFGHRMELMRACTVPDKPFLLLRQANYNVFFEQNVSFQHRIIAKHISIRDENEMVADVNLDVLRSPDSTEMAALQPSVDAILWSDSSSVTSASSSANQVVKGRIIERTEPFYPDTMKQRGIQGVVRLAATIGKDGRLKNLEVLHSPALDLTNSAEDAVKRWVYEPYTIGGLPVEVSTQVFVTFVLDRW